MDISESFLLPGSFVFGDGGWRVLVVDVEIKGRSVEVGL